MIKFFHYFIFVFLFSGCISTYKYTLPLAPEYYIAPTDRNIFIASQSLFTDSIEYASIKIIPFDSMVAITIKGALENLGKLSGAQIILPDSVSENLLKSESSNKIDSLFNLTKSTSLLFIKDWDVSVESGIGTYKNEFGRIVSGDQFFISLTTNWRMYFKQDATFEDFKQVEESFYNSAEMFYYLQTNDYVIRNLLFEISKLSYQSGKNFLSRFLTYQDTIEIFIFEDQALLLGNSLLRSNKKEDARKEFVRVAEKVKRKMSAKAYYNIAISYEAEQNYTQALIYAQKSFQLYPTNMLILALNEELPVRKKDYDTWKLLKD